MITPRPPPPNAAVCVLPSLLRVFPRDYGIPQTRKAEGELSTGDRLRRWLQKEGEHTNICTRTQLHGTVEKSGPIPHLHAAGISQQSAPGWAEVGGADRVDQGSTRSIAYTFSEVRTKMQDEGQMYPHRGEDQRALFELFGVTEDDGVYVLIAGLILIVFSVVGCCYCKVYDPLRVFCVKKITKWCAKKPKKPPAPPPDDAPAEVRKPEMCHPGSDPALLTEVLLVRGSLPCTRSVFHPPLLLLRSVLLRARAWRASGESRVYRTHKGGQVL